MSPDVCATVVPNYLAELQDSFGILRRDHGHHHKMAIMKVDTNNKMAAMELWEQFKILDSSTKCQEVPSQASSYN